MSERFGRGASEDGGSARKADNRKQSLYFPETVLQDMKEQAARLDRSLSWVVQRAWKLAAAQIKALPSMGDAGDTGPTSDPDSDEG